MIAKAIFTSSCYSEVSDYREHVYKDGCSISDKLTFGLLRFIYSMRSANLVSRYTQIKRKALTYTQLKGNVKIWCLKLHKPDRSPPTHNWHVSGHKDANGSLVQCRAALVRLQVIPSWIPKSDIPAFHTASIAKFWSVHEFSRPVHWND